MFVEGQGVAQSDATEALRWYHKAANQGPLSSALLNLGIAYKRRAEAA